jgi:hypothetical protein
MNAGADLDRGFSARAYHVYRASDGMIVLTHTFVGHAVTPDDGATIERDLLAEASRTSRLSPSELRIMSRDARYPTEGRIVRVDPKTGELVTTDEAWPKLPQRSS